MSQSWKIFVLQLKERTVPCDIRLCSAIVISQQNNKHNNINQRQNESYRLHLKAGKEYCEN